MVSCKQWRKPSSSCVDDGAIRAAEVDAGFRGGRSTWDIVAAMQEDEASISTTSGLAALQKNEELLDLAQEAGHLGLFEWLVQAGTLRLSPNFLLLYGLLR